VMQGDPSLDPYGKVRVLQRINKVNIKRITHGKRFRQNY
jgi:hypothetical protein